jgi:hypothetical protein
MFSPQSVMVTTTTLSSACWVQTREGYILDRRSWVRVPLLLCTGWSCPGPDACITLCNGDTRGRKEASRPVPVHGDIMDPLVTSSLCGQYIQSPWCDLPQLTSVINITGTVWIYSESFTNLEPCERKLNTIRPREDRTPGDIVRGCTPFG